MPEPARLQIFVSYASEDEQLASAINSELRRAFNPGVVRTTFAAEFQLGSSWRDRIEEELSKTDILLVVATGRQKLSHSFTGFEVGYFRGSKKHEPRMRHFKSERLIIPIAIFSKIPESIDNVEGLEIEGPLTPLMVDPSTLKDPDRFLKAAAYNNQKNPLLRLFTRIQGVISTTIEFNPEERATFDEQIQASSKRLHDTLFNELRNRVSTENYPERKLIVKLQPVARGTVQGDPLEGAVLQFFGRSFDVFGLDAPSRGDLSMADFIQSISDPNMTAAWVEIIRSLVASAQAGDFGENRRVLTSSDHRRFFRLFVARSVLYYSGVNEIHIHVVEVKSRDYGDPTTTLLLKAISVGLQYRFLFLERTSEFSPASFYRTLINDFRKKVSTLVQELDYLLWLSKDAGLSDSHSLLLIYGDDPLADLDRQSESWEREKEALYASAYRVIGAQTSDALILEKADFLAHLTRFCAATYIMNRDFTSRVLRSLEGMVSNQQAPSFIGAPERVAVSESSSAKAEGGGAAV